MKLHVLTAVTRPDNLTEIARSLPASVTWHLAFDMAHEHIGGQAVKNRLLDEVSDGWVYVLDDDTIMHPDLLSRCRAVAGETTRAVVVNMELPGAGLLHAQPSPHIGGVDIGQVLFRRDFLGDRRIPETYEGDGELLSELLQGPDIVYLSETLAYYNRLR